MPPRAPASVSPAVGEYLCVTPCCRCAAHGPQRATCALGHLAAQRCRCRRAGQHAVLRGADVDQRCAARLRELADDDAALAGLIEHCTQACAARSARLSPAQQYTVQFLVFWLDVEQFRLFDGPDDDAAHYAQVRLYY